MFLDKPYKEIKARKPFRAKHNQGPPGRLRLAAEQDLRVIRDLVLVAGGL